MDDLHLINLLQARRELKKEIIRIQKELRETESLVMEELVKSNSFDLLKVDYPKLQRIISR